MVKSLQFLAIVLIALALVPSGAHVLELPHKIGLGREQYLVVQLIYRGWSLAAVPLIGALVATLALAAASRAERLPCRLAAAAFVLILASLISFFVWIYPVNRETADWTTAPEHWQALRARWEYAHAANAGLVFAALLCALLSALAWRGD